MSEIPELSEKEEIESLAQLIEEVQHTVNKAVRRRGLKGDEFHPLNILDVALFGVCCQARIAAGGFGKAKEKP